MAELTRRRYPERPDCWHVYYGDVRVGTIAVRVGIPHDEDRWAWICGFYSGASIRGLIPVNRSPVPGRRLTRRVRALRKRGDYFRRSAPRPIIRRGAMPTRTALVTNPIQGQRSAGTGNCSALQGTAFKVGQPVLSRVNAVLTAGKRL